MFERGPFTPCPKCGRPDSMGLLGAGGNFVTFRCRECRYSVSEPLPEVNKDVVYLDQFAISNLFKVKAGGNLGPHDRFWRGLSEAVQAALLRQQAIFPTSDVHHRETIISPFAGPLREAYELMGGDIELKDTHQIEMAQAWQVADAILGDRAPIFDTDIDQLLLGERNAWLPDLHIGVNANYEQFADEIRASMDRTHDGMQQLIATWAAERPTFAEAFERELASYGNSKRNALRRAMEAFVRIQSDTDVFAMLAAIHEPIWQEYLSLKDTLRRAGIAEDQLDATIGRIWDDERNRLQPHFRLSAALFAALAWKVANGQRRITRGFMNDIAAIASYGPSVDAMFVDNECASLIRDLPEAERPAAHIFSLNERDAFLAYVQSLADRAPEEVIAYAARIYGA